MTERPTERESRKLIEDEIRSLELKHQALTVLRDTIDWVNVSEIEDHRLWLGVREYMGLKG